MSVQFPMELLPKWRGMRNQYIRHKGLWFRLGIHTVFVEYSTWSSRKVVLFGRWVSAQSHNEIMVYGFDSSPTTHRIPDSPPGVVNGGMS